MTGFELATAVAYKLPLLVVCLSDGELGMMSGLQRNAGKEPFCTVLCGYNPMKVAEAAGVSARRVTSETELLDAVAWAREHIMSGHGPVFLDISTAYAFPSFYARGIVNAKAPEVGSIMPPPIVRQPFAPSKALIDAEYTRCVKQNAFDLWDLFERATANDHASSDAFVLRNGCRLRYDQLYERVSGLAQFLVHELCLGVSDIIGVLAPNVRYYEFVLVLLFHFYSIAILPSTTMQRCIHPNR